LAVASNGGNWDTSGNLVVMVMWAVAMAMVMSGDEWDH
jgi:hypothetical protein